MVLTYFFIGRGCMLRLSDSIVTPCADLPNALAWPLARPVHPHLLSQDVAESQRLSVKSVPPMTYVGTILDCRDLRKK